MNRTFDSNAPANSPRLTDGASAVPSAPRGFTSDQALFRLDLMRSLRMHRRLAIGFILAGLLLAAIYTVFNWSIYTAQSLVYIQPTPSAVMEAAPMHWPYNYDPATYDSYIQQQMLSMMRPDVLAGAVRKLAPGVWQQSGESDQSAADRLKGAVEVARVGSSYQVAITAHATNPDTAAALANAVAASYIENTSHEQKASDSGRLTMLKEEQERITKELADDRAEQAELNAQLGVAAIGPEAPQHYDSDIAQIHAELVKARSDHDEAAARLTSINSGSGLSSAALNAEADQLISTDPGLASLKQALLTRRATLVSHMSGKTPDNPQYKQDQEEIQKIDASLESETQDLRAKAAARIEEQLRTDLDRTASLEARLNGELAQMTRAAAGATPKLQRSSDLANDITRLQTRYNAVDEQLQNQTLEDSAPGTAHLAEAAVPPTHPAIAGVVRNALLLLFAFIFIGLAAAVLAHKLDPHVYVAADVEQLLGYAPMAQLPDFDEVSDEVAEEHLLRLASSIEFAANDGQLTSYVFTGTGPGVGVTTITSRIKEMLGVLGKEAALVDAAGPVPAERLPGTELQRNTRATPLLSQNGEGIPFAREGLMLTDAAPLTVSAEAEYFARRADCTILVIESGVTTRAQLRSAASSLQRLNPAAVGFVLNRVSLKNADESFRNSVSEVERHLRVQGLTAARTAAQSPRIVPGATHVSPMRQIPAPAETAERTAPQWAAPGQAAVAPQPLSQPAPVVAENREPQLFPQPAPVVPASLRRPTALAALRNIAPPSLWLAGGASQPAQEPAAKPVRKDAPQPVLKPMPAFDPIREPKPQSASWTETPPVQQPQDETPHWLTEEPPWWMTKSPTYTESAMEQLPTPHTGAWHSVAAHDRQNPAVAEAREEEKAPDEMPTRLSGLRGVLFSLGVKDLSPKKSAEPHGNGNGAPANAPPSHPEQTMVAEASVPQPEPETAEAEVESKAEEPASRRAAPRWVTAEPEFLPPPIEETDKGKESRWDLGKYDTGVRDDIQILPSRRGQYKR
jgi:uncharacterized protein involved in exopolysaccharide biosynthesis